MGKANWYWDTKNRRWTLRDGAGVTQLLVDNGGVAVTNMNVTSTGTLSAAQVQTIKIKAGNTVSKGIAVAGTLPLTNIGSGSVTTVTLTGVASAGIAVGDLIFGRADGALIANVGVAGLLIPTTNVVTVMLANTNPASVGSFPPIGFKAWVQGYS